MAQTWQAQAFNDVDAFQKLPLRTDEWTPCRPSRAASSQVKMLISKFESLPLTLPNPIVTATIDAGIDLEWHHHGRELDITVSSGGEIEYLKVIERTPMEEGALNLDDVPELADWLLGH